MINLDRIGWQNGTLVSKAKVEINGQIYEVDPEEYSGITPLSAENLRQMETNTENAINEVNSIVRKETVLYNNNSGTPGVVTLSENANNFDYLIITMGAGGTPKTIRVDRFNSEIFEEVVYSAGSEFFHAFSKFVINTNNIQPVAANCGYYTINYINSAVAMHLDTTNYIYITKVVGVKY